MYSLHWCNFAPFLKCYIIFRCFRTKLPLLSVFLLSVMQAFTKNILPILAVQMVHTTLHYTICFVASTCDWSFGTIKMCMGRMRSWHIRFGIHLCDVHAPMYVYMWHGLTCSSLKHQACMHPFVAL